MDEKEEKKNRTAQDEKVGRAAEYQGTLAMVTEAWVVL